MSTPEKKNPAEAGLPGRIGDAIGIRDCAVGRADLQLPDDAAIRFWYAFGRAAATLDRLEARLGIVREVRHAG